MLRKPDQQLSSAKVSSDSILLQKARRKAWFPGIQTHRLLDFPQRARLRRRLTQQKLVPYQRL